MGLRIGIRGLGLAREADGAGPVAGAMLAVIGFTA